jgi:hypothetical protein
LLTGLTFTDTELVNGLTYRYHVIAHYTDPIGESQPSIPAFAIPYGETKFPYAPHTLRGRLDDGNVYLTWSKPDYFEIFDGTFFSHTLSDEHNDGIGLGDNAPIDAMAVHRFTPEQLTDLDIAGQLLTMVSFIGLRSTGGAAHWPNAQFSIRVWNGGSWTETPGAGRNPGTLRVTQNLPVGSVVSGVWTNVHLDTPVLIPTDQELWIGYRLNIQGGHPLGCDGPGQTWVNHFGNIFFWNTWQTMFEAGGDNSTLRYNWMVRGLASDPEGNPISFGTPLAIEESYETNPSTDGLYMTSAGLSNNHSRGSRNFIGYQVFRDGSSLGNLVFEESFVDFDPPAGTYEYFVIALYEDDLSSEPTNTVTVPVTEKIRVVVTPSEPWFEDFTLATSITLGFTRRNVSGLEGNAFNWSRLANFTYDGPNGCAMSFSMSGGESSNPDNWLITPRLVLPEIGEEGAISLTYVVNSRSGGGGTGVLENYSVYVTTENSTLLDAFDLEADLLYTYRLGEREWHYKKHSLTKFAGQTILIAFRHHDVYPGQSTIILDNLKVEVTISDYDHPVVPIKNALRGNFPNPFNPETSIAFTMANEGHVSIEVFNIRGQKVTTILSEERAAGDHHIIWRGTDEQGRSVGSGIYFYRMTTGDFTQTRRMVLMK